MSAKLYLEVLHIIICKYQMEHKTLQGKRNSIKCADLKFRHFEISNNNLTLSNTAAGAITGTYSMYEYDSNQWNRLFTKVGALRNVLARYPVVARYYNPLDLTSSGCFTATGTGNLQIRATTVNQVQIL